MSHRSFFRRIYVPFLVGSVSLLASGCGEFHALSPEEVLTHPFGTQAPFPLGASKRRVLADWGEPDEVIGRGVDELGNTREEWIYVGRLPAVPVDYGYVSQTKHLFFEGENLVRWKTAEVSSAEPAEESADSPPLVE